jgi:hypothetical protein
MTLMKTLIQIVTDWIRDTLAEIASRIAGDSLTKWKKRRRKKKDSSSEQTPKRPESEKRS